MRKVALIGAAAAILVFGGGFALAYWGYHFLEKPEGVRWLIKTANGMSPSTGVTIDAESGRVSLFSGFNFNNLRVELTTPGSASPLVVTIQEFKAVWNMAWLRRHLRVEQFRVKGVRLEGEFVSQPAATEEEEEETSGEGPWATLENLPLEIEIVNLALEEISGELNLKAPEGETRVSLHELNDQLSGRVAPGLMLLKNQFRLKAAVQQQPAAQNTDGQNLALELTQGLEIDAKVQQGLPQILIRHYDLSGLVEFQGAKAPLRRLTLTGSQGETQRLSHLWQAEGLKLDEKTTARADGELHWDVEFPLKVFRLETSARLDGEELLQTKANYSLVDSLVTATGLVRVPPPFQPAAVKLGSLHFELEMKMADLKPHLKLDSDEIQLQGVKFKPALELIADVSEGARPSVEGEIKIDQATWMVFEAQTQLQDQTTAADFKLKATPQGALWKALKPGLVSLEQGLQISGKVIAGSSTQVDVKVVSETPDEEMNLNFVGELLPTQELQISKLEADALGGELHLDVNGRYHLAREAGQLKGQVAINSQGPRLKKLVPDLGVEGRLHFPFALAINLKGATAIDGHLEFKGFKLKGANYELRGINGIIPLAEEFKMSGDKFMFSRLLRRNGFERVDFNSFRPLLAGSRPLKIDTIHFEKRVYGPFTGFVSLQQNLLTLHQFDFHAGGARFAGESYVDLQPRNLQVGFLMRFSQVDFLKLLPQKYLHNLKPGPPLHGRTNFTVDLTKSSVVGRTDILEISANQLLALLNLMDPEYKDDKMNKVRSVLGYAYPTYVGLDFSHSYLDVRVDTNVGRLPQVKAVPIGSTLSDVSSQVTKLMAEVPLK
ncbi:MAG: hypothetical protein IT288_08615 [Bdellovibrionales bacterium]|nr:hypothetical protein [Bdellovibrionales bacterium]